MWKLIFFVAVANCQKLVPFNQCGINDVIFRVIFFYFKDQHFMTVIDGDKEFNAFDSYDCLGEEYFRPVSVYSDWKKVDMAQRIDTSSVTSFSTTNGYFIKGEILDITDDFFETISKFNPRIQLMFTIKGANVEYSQDILKRAYDEYKMLNVAAIILKPEFKEGVLYATSLMLSIYNPFRKQPEFGIWDINNKNLHQILKEFDNFYLSRVRDLKSFPLKISIFEYEMTSLAIYDEQGKLQRFTYPDGELAAVIAKNMNATPVYEQVRDEPKHGVQNIDGSFTGSLGQVEQGTVDLVANARLIANYNTTKSIFLQPISMTKLYFVVQRRGVSKIMMVTFLQELDKVSQLVVISLTFLLPFMLILLHKLELSLLHKDTDFSISRLVLYCFGIWYGISLRHPNGTSTRIVIAAILFLSLIMNSLFQGSILKDLNANRKIGRITTIQQILDQNFRIAMIPVLTFAFQGEAEDNVTRALIKITKNLDEVSLESEKAIPELIDDDKFAFLWTDSLSGNYLNNFFDNKTGENFIEVVPESPFEFYSALIAPKASPFIETFNEIISFYMQSGLYQHNAKEAQNDNHKVWIYRVKNGFVPKEEKRPLSLTDLQGVFKVYLSFIAVSSFAFIIEVFIKFLTTH